MEGLLSGMEGLLSGMEGLLSGIDRLFSCNLHSGIPGIPVVCRSSVLICVAHLWEIEVHKKNGW